MGNSSQLTGAFVAPGPLAITADQRARERSILFAILADAAIIAAMIQIGLFGGSFTILAEAVRASLMLAIEIFSLVVMRRIHRGVLRGYEFGHGKLEQLASLSIAVSMFGGAIWIAFGVLDILAGARPLGTPFGLALAAMLGALNTWVNIIAWDMIRRAARSGGSIIMQAQLRSRTVKLFSSLFVQATMTVAAVSLNDVIVAWADAIGSAFVAGFIVINAIEMLRSGLPDLLDRTVEEKVQIAINRALAQHFNDYDRLDRVRSRRAGEQVFIEIALGYDRNLGLGEADRRAEILKRTLNEEIAQADVSILISPSPNPSSAHVGETERKPGPLELQEAKKGTALVVTAPARLDAATAADFQRRLLALIEGGESRILLDFSYLSSMSSVGLRPLLVTAKRLERDNGQFAVCSLAATAASLFNASGFDAVVTIFPDEDAALASYE
jgi:cation diffusion facilitator family transporter/anti-anti-sigma factor